MIKKKKEKEINLFTQSASPKQQLMVILPDIACQCFPGLVGGQAVSERVGGVVRGFTAAMVSVQ